jgi:uracil-DNA glycosylase family 4
MNNLHSLYAAEEVQSHCKDCSILLKKKPVYCVEDYKNLKPSDVLFLSDSIKHRFGKSYAFSKQEIEIISDFFPGDTYQMAASVKCPSVKEADMSPANMEACRNYLQATIDKVKPRLVFVCGNLAMKMLIKKSGITDKRGKSYDYSTDNGHDCVVVPIFHPYSVVKEPRHRVLFETDIRNAYEKYVLGKTHEGKLEYKVLTDIQEVVHLAEKLKDSEETLAMDIETTGLNFLTDSIQTIAISSRETNWVIPCDHKDSPFRKGEPDYGKMWVSLRAILQNPRNKKVFHNAKFDLKFLINYGIYTKNVWDTKIMHHLLDENLPKSLMDLVKLYFPTELESL